jgi:hypothetical protein
MDTETPPCTDLAVSRWIRSLKNAVKAEAAQGRDII